MRAAMVRQHPFRFDGPLGQGAAWSEPTLRVVHRSVEQSDCYEVPFALFGERTDGRLLLGLLGVVLQLHLQVRVDQLVLDGFNAVTDHGDNRPADQGCERSQVVLDSAGVLLAVVEGRGGIAQALIGRPNRRVVGGVHHSTSNRATIASTTLDRGFAAASSNTIARRNRSADSWTRTRNFS
ncbi:MAG TPA: hypothetical protein PLV68_05470, partial [Ilumatobacteraceae bacterium]|nr:hypothetical protein [Ilumatobacteraceae bacterium]